MHTLVIIPAYNEAKTIGSVIDAVRAHTSHIVVINDGSSDDTARIARAKGCQVKSHVINRGLGAALRTGFAHALQTEAQYVVTLDADGQHDPDDIPRLTEFLQQGHDAVIGSRLINTDGMPATRIVANKFANAVTYGGHITTDSQSGLRAFKRDALKRMTLNSDRMEISSEIIEEIYKNKLRFREIPIKPVYTEYSLAKGQSFTVGLQTWWRLFMIRIFK